MKDSMQIAVFFMLQHLSFVICAVTIDFNSIGYINQSIVLQCKDTANVTVSNADWFRGGSFLVISSSKYTETRTPDGFNLTIYSLVSADGGAYHCGIDLGTSRPKTLTIYYNTRKEDVVTEGNTTTKTIAVTFTAFPDPVFDVTVTENGNLKSVNWTTTRTTQSSGAIMVSHQSSTVFESKSYILTVNITSPVPLVVMRKISFVATTLSQSTAITTTEKEMETKTSPPLTNTPTNTLTNTTTNTSKTNKSGTDNNEHVIIISVSVSVGVPVVGVPVIIISFQFYRRRREQKKKLKQANNATDRQETPNPAYGVFSAPRESCDVILTITSQDDSCPDRDEVTKSNSNKGISNEQIQLSTDISNQTSTSHQDRNNKPLREKNEIKL